VSNEQRPTGVEPYPTSVRTLHLNSGGTIALTVSVDWLKLSKSDREWLFGLVDKVTAYESGATHDSPLRLEEVADGDN
jgi:hypothetical protein